MYSSGLLAEIVYRSFRNIANTHLVYDYTRHSGGHSEILLFCSSCLCVFDVIAAIFHICTIERQRLYGKVILWACFKVQFTLISGHVEG